jgi:hypothetical protein
MASVLFVGNVGCAFVGLRIVDVPLFLCVRRVTTVCVLVTEYLMLGKVASNKILSAVGLIMLGTVLAGYETLSANFVGYAFVMGNNILTAMLYTEVRAGALRAGVSGSLYQPLCVCLYRASPRNYSKRNSETSRCVRACWQNGVDAAMLRCCCLTSCAPSLQGLQSFGLLYYNAVTALPLCLCIAYYLGEFDLLASFPYVGDTVRWSPSVAVPIVVDSAGH